MNPRITTGRQLFKAWTRLGLALVLTIAPWAGALGETRAELRKLHALLVVDTRSGLGESVKIDGERIDRLLSNNVPRDRAEIRVLTGKEVNAEAILAHYRNLKAGPDDALFFYYAGHGATDPEKGHFLALQELKSKPLLRADLRRAMQQHHPGLVVLMTDCCSNRYNITGTARRIYVDQGTAKTIQPVLRCLFYQSRGVVDITAASGNAAFGDDHDGGIFTHTFAKLIDGGIAGVDSDHDQFVTWEEFFARVQKETEGAFLTWARRHRTLGEEVNQKSQRPHAFLLGTDRGTFAVRLRNETVEELNYEYRWNGMTSWEKGHIAPSEVAEHRPPQGRDNLSSPTLEVRFKDGTKSELKPGKTYRFHDSR
jgi:hypothetical protein